MKKTTMVIFRNEEETLQRNTYYDGCTNKGIIWDLLKFGMRNNYDEMVIRVNRKKIFSTKDIPKSYKKLKQKEEIYS